MTKLQKSHVSKKLLRVKNIEKIFQHFIKEHPLFDKVCFLALLFLLIIICSAFSFLNAHIISFNSTIQRSDTYRKVDDFSDSFKALNTSSPLFSWEKTIFHAKEKEIQTDSVAFKHYQKGLSLVDANNYSQATLSFNEVSQLSQDYIDAKSEEKRAETIASNESSIQSKFQDTLAKASTEVSNGDTLNAENDFSEAYKIAISDRVLSVQTDTLSSINANLDSLESQINQAKDIAKQAKIQEVSLHQTQGPIVTSLRVPILMYHYIRVNPDPTDIIGYNLSVTPQDFDEQMKYLANNHYNSITMMDLVNALKNNNSLPSKPIIITFDDGYTDFYTEAYPILKKYNLKGESYIITNFANHYRYLTWDQIKEMYQSGLITFGSHSIDHPDLRTLSPSELQKEVVESKVTLETELNTTITDFCYPLGDFNSQVVQAVKDAGYIDATTTQESAIHTSTDFEQMPRIRMEGGMSLESFIEQL